MTRFHFQLQVDMQEQDYLLPPKRSIQPKFQSSRIEIELEVHIVIASIRTPAEWIARRIMKIDALSQEHFLSTELHYLNITRNWSACVRQCTIPTVLLHKNFNEYILFENVLGASSAKKDHKVKVT